jgi:phenylalanyl-tRNA synthetase beta chain
LTGLTTGKFAPVFWKESSANVNFYDLKGVVLHLFDSLSIENIELRPSDEPYFFPNSGFSIHKKHEYGVIGKLDPKVLAEFDIDTDVYLFDLDLDMMLKNADFRVKRFVEMPKFPTVFRDLSFVLSNEYLIADIVKTVIEVNQRIIKKVVPFDEFKGKQIKEGFRSLSISLSLNAETKTLTDELTKTIINKVIERLQTKYNIEMR